LRQRAGDGGGVHDRADRVRLDADLDRHDLAVRHRPDAAHDVLAAGARPLAGGDAVVVHARGEDVGDLDVRVRDRAAVRDLQRVARRLADEEVRGRGRLRDREVTFGAVVVGTVIDGVVAGTFVVFAVGVLVLVDPPPPPPPPPPPVLVVPPPPPPPPPPP